MARKIPLIGGMFTDPVMEKRIAKMKEWQAEDRLPKNADLKYLAKHPEELRKILKDAPEGGPVASNAATEEEAGPDIKTILPESVRNVNAERVFDQGRNTILERIAPTRLKEDLSYYMIDDRYYSTIAITRWPPSEEVRPGIMNRLVSASSKSMLAYHLHRIPDAVASQYLNKLQGKVRAEQQALQEKRVTPAAQEMMEARIRDINEQIKRLARGDEKYYHFSLYMRVGGKSKDDLRRNITKLKQTLNGLKFRYRELPGRQLLAMRATMPYADDQVYRATSFTTSNLQNTLPFLTRQMHHSRGVLYGVHQHNKTLITDTPFKSSQEAEIMCVIGNRGSGKTFWTRNFMSRMAMVGTQIIAIDPLGDFVEWFKLNGGQAIGVYPGSPYHVNPLRLARTVDGDIENIDNKIARLMPLFKMLIGADLFGGVHRGETILEAALKDMYLNHGTDEKLMKDFIEVLRTNSVKYEGNRKETASQIISDLEDRCLRGAFSTYFENKSNVDLTSDKIVFDISQADGIHKQYGTYMSMTLSYELASSTRNRKILVIDETWRFLRNAVGDNQSTPIQESLLAFAKESRHWGTSMVMVTQSLVDFPAEGGHESNPLQQLVNTYIMMKQSSEAVETAIRRLGIPVEVAEIIREEQQLSERSDNKPRTGLIVQSSSFVPFVSVALQHEMREIGQKS